MKKHTKKNIPGAQDILSRAPAAAAFADGWDSRCDIMSQALWWLLDVLRWHGWVSG